MQSNTLHIFLFIFLFILMFILDKFYNSCIILLTVKFFTKLQNKLKNITIMKFNAKEQTIIYLKTIALTAIIFSVYYFVLAK